MNKKLIQNGLLIFPKGSKKADLLIVGEKISQIGENLSTENAQIIDAAGKLVFPGFIDAHTHFDLAVANCVTADDFASGTAAAVVGGTTVVVDYCTQYRGETMRQALQNWKQKASVGCSCDYGFHMAITDWTPETHAECHDIMDEGVTTFKLYLTYDTQVDDETLFKILQRLKEVGGIAGVHCENSGMIAALQQEYAADERISKISSHYLTRPPASEAEAIGRLLHFAEVIDTPVIDVHLTGEEGLNEIRAARRRGQKVYVETCPQYLCMDDSLYELPGFEGAKYIIAPPLRKPKDNQVLWEALAAGEIQTIATDHCSFTLAQKELGKSDFRKIPGGMPGAETCGRLIFSEGVCKGRITQEKMCEVLCENPAKLYGMYPQKGVLAPGSDADIVILDPSSKEVITASRQMSRCGYSPFEGKELTGTVDQVYLRGELVAQNGKLIQKNCGRFLRRGRFAL